MAKGSRVPDPAAGLDPGLIVRIAQDMGEMKGMVGEMGKRVDEAASLTQNVADNLENLQQRNAEAHETTARTLGSVVSRLEAGDKRFDELRGQLQEHDERLRALEGKKGDGDPIAGWDKAMEFGKKWWPGLLVILGAVWTAVDKLIHKGS